MSWLLHSLNIRLLIDQMMEKRNNVFSFNISIQAQIAGLAEITRMKVHSLRTV